MKDYTARIIMKDYTDEELLRIVKEVFPPKSPNMNNPNEFSLSRAMAGEPIETVTGKPRIFIAHRPDRRERLRVIVLDPVADKLYSHHESGEHCESVHDLALRMRPKARRKVKRYVVTKCLNLHKPTMLEKIVQIDENTYEHRPDAEARASLLNDGQVHEITVEVDDN